MDEEQLESVRKNFSLRVKQAFEAERGKPLIRAKKNPPLAPGRGNYVRGYSWSIIDFAARCFFLNERILEASAALVENARHYLDNPKDIQDRDSFHWHADMACRLIEMYGTHGSAHPGLIPPEAERLILEPLWQYTDLCTLSTDADLEKAHSWHIHESDNHHVMRFTTAWHAEKLAAAHPDFKNRRHRDGTTPEERYKAWNAYIKAYCEERAKKGLFVEIASDGYNVVAMKGIYNVYDFAEDPVLKRQAGHLLDLHWGMWAQEQIDGVRGGGKTRIYPSGAKSGSSPMRQLAWFYFGMAEPSRPASPILSALLSSWRPPLVVVDIALDPEDRGNYEILHRPMGLAETGFDTTPDYRLRKEGGGILCVSWCTPGFILGAPMVEARPLRDWARISSQNRWNGAIFSGDAHARIVPFVRPADGKVAYNAQWAVQRKGTQITQKLKTAAGAAEMCVWFSQHGLSAPVQDGDWFFIEAKKAFAAVRVVRGGMTWEAEESSGNAPSGLWLRCADEFSPVILEVANKGEFADLNHFQLAVRALPMDFENDVLEYRGLSGDKFIFFADQSRSPEINGDSVDYTPAKVLYSPFLKSNWDSGVVTLEKDHLKTILDFRQ